jgi:hypothetical protein
VRGWSSRVAEWPLLSPDAQRQLLALFAFVSGFGAPQLRGGQALGSAQADLGVSSEEPFAGDPSAKAWVDAGGLISYGQGPDIGYRRAATYLDKILKGTKLADLPVEAPKKSS